MWLSLFAGRPAAAAVGLPLYGMIPGGSYLKTLNPYDRKNMMTFLVFPPGIVDVFFVGNPAVSARCLWRNPG